MKYFICTLENNNAGNCLLGIPAEHTERIIPVNRMQTAIFETDNDEAFLSVPVLLKLKDRSTPHGLVLKTRLDSKKSKIIKTVLLLPRVEVEMEIPEEQICQLPEVFNEMFKYFRGIYFSSNMILILDPEKLMESVK